MPPILPKTPNVKTFTDAWTKQFEAAVKTAAGRDGRLSITEAKRIAERTDGGRFFSDNAVAWLYANRQSTVSATKLVEAARAYAEKSAASVAGRDGFVSYEDAKRLRPDLRDDFLYLRGKIVDPPQRTQAQLTSDVRDAVLRAFDNGSAKKLSGPPATVRGRRELIDHMPHAASNTALSVWVANDRMYVSRAATAGSGSVPLVGWYDAGPVPPVGTRRADLRAKFDSATSDLWLMSESDARVKFVSVEGAPKGPITADVVRQKLGGAHDTLGPTIYGYKDDSFVPLAERSTVQEQDALAWLEGKAEVSDPEDPEAVATAGRWRALINTVKSELTDVKLYRFGEVNISVFIVGKTKDGDLAGVYSAVVET